MALVGIWGPYYWPFYRGPYCGLQGGGGSSGLEVAEFVERWVQPEQVDSLTFTLRL